MSSFKMTARHKKTGEIHPIWCIYDYFGRHVYGYIPNVEGGVALNIDEFESQYTPHKTEASEGGE